MDLKISQCVDAVLPFTGAEMVPVVQNGQNRKAPPSAFFDGAGNVVSVNGQTGVVTLDAADVGAVPVGGNISLLTNDVGYITANQAITFTGDVTGTGTTNIALTIGAGKVTNAMLVNGAATSLLGRSANSSGVRADIAATVDGQVMRRAGAALGFGSIDLNNGAAVGSSILSISNGGTGLNGVGAANSILAVGTGGGNYSFKALSLNNADVANDLGITHTENDIVISVPSATASIRGVVSTLDQTFAGIKTFSGVKITGLVQGAVLIGGASNAISQDSSTFFWDSTNDRLGLSTVNPAARLHIAANNSVATAQIRLGAAGSLLNTPQAGAIETTATHIYWTDGSAVRWQLDQQAPSIGVGAAGQSLITNTSGATEWSNLISETVAGTTYTFTANDNGKLKIFTNSLGCTVTVPEGLPLGWSALSFRDVGAGVISFAGQGTVTFRGTGTSIPAAQTMAALYHNGSNQHIITGALSTIGAGTVTSVNIASIGGFATAGSPVTTSGNISLTLNNQNANTVFAGPASGAAAPPTFRSPVLADLPNDTWENVTGTTYTFLAADNKKRKRFTNASGCAVTIPVSLPTGWNVECFRDTAAGLITFTSQGTFEGISNIIGSAKGECYIFHRGSDVHVMIGGGVAITATGTSNQILAYNNAGTNVEYKTLSISPAAISGDVGLTLTNPNSIVINLPSASGTDRGLLTAAAQTIGGAKTFSVAPLITTMTAGSVLFAGAAGLISQDNANFFWDDANNRLGVGTLTTIANAMITTVKDVNGTTYGIWHKNNTVGTASVSALRVQSANNTVFDFRIHENTHSSNAGQAMLNSNAVNGLVITTETTQSILIRNNLGGTPKSLAAFTNTGVGIGTVTAPTAMLHLPAGTATAGTAPMKFTTGVALTTPSDGALEYHGSHLWFTIGSTRFQLDQQGGGGFTNGAAVNEIIKSNGPGAGIASGLFVSTNGNITLGSNVIAGGRIIDVASSDANASFTAQSKGTGNANLISPTGSVVLTSSASTLSWNSSSVLASNGQLSITSNALPITITAGTHLNLASSILKPITTTPLTVNTTAGNTHHTILVNATSGSRTITLPAASTAGRFYIIKKTDATANTVVIDGNASETIDGATTVTLTVQNQSVTIQSDGTGWRIVSSAGGFTNTAATNELIKSNGSLSGIGSNVFVAAATANMTLGTASLAGGRVIDVASSDANASLGISSKGAGDLTLATGSAGGNVYIGNTSSRLKWDATNGRFSHETGGFHIYGNAAKISVTGGSLFEVGAAMGVVFAGLVSVSINTTLNDSNFTVLVNASGASRTITLPAVNTNIGRIYVIKKIDSSANTVVIDGNGGELIDGAATLTLTTQYQGVMIQTDGTQWRVISSF